MPQALTCYPATDLALAASRNAPLGKPFWRPPPSSNKYFREPAACAHHVVTVAPSTIVCTVQFGILHPDQREQLPQSFKDGILGEMCEGPRTSF